VLGSASPRRRRRDGRRSRERLSGKPRRDEGGCNGYALSDSLYIAALKALIDLDSGEWRSGLGVVDELVDKGVARPALPTSADPLSPLEA